MNRNRSGFAVMAGLIGMIKPMLGIMLLAVLMGCIGNLMATFITVLGGYGLLTVTGYYGKMSLTLIITLMAVFAVLRGVLRYAEQACNHFIAFKLLARIRHQVFTALRKLSPAKLDGSEKGNLISIITSDIELLEVFYAHTILPLRQFPYSDYTDCHCIYYICSDVHLPWKHVSVFCSDRALLLPDCRCPDSIVERKAGKRIRKKLPGCVRQIEYNRIRQPVWFGRNHSVWQTGRAYDGDVGADRQA